MSGVIKISRTSPIRVRLREISSEIGQAHLDRDHGLHARLSVEKALYLELLEASGGTRELLAQAQKDAAEALERVENQSEALKFYRKALENRSRIIKYLVGKESTIRGQQEDIARFKGILADNPDKTTRAKIETELRSRKLLLPEETLRYEVNVEEVEKLISLLEQQKRETERESEFTQSQLRIVKNDLIQLQAKIKHLEEKLNGDIDPK